eukprot:103870-Chlamydomonas_euryale.AAC.1
MGWQARIAFAWARESNSGLSDWACLDKLGRDANVRGEIPMMTPISPAHCATAESQPTKTCCPVPPHCFAVHPSLYSPRSGKTRGHRTPLP